MGRGDGGKEGKGIRTWVGAVAEGCCWSYDVKECIWAFVVRGVGDH